MLPEAGIPAGSSLASESFCGRSGETGTPQFQPITDTDWRAASHALKRPTRQLAPPPPPTLTPSNHNRAWRHLGYNVYIFCSIHIHYDIWFRTSLQAFVYMIPCRYVTNRSQRILLMERTKFLSLILYYNDPRKWQTVYNKLLLWVM